ncbi:MAG: LytTR family DNA-binding domain-containing protein, partial [Finegoldia magna]|nr:LytTR family DNA-binding domain-containing protein [Finegoldia magna]
MNIAIVDDEENIRNLYRKYCEEWANINKIDLKTKLFSSGENFIFNYDENDYIDILLLDVEMKKINGVELSKRIREKNSDIQIIFISGYPEYIGYGYDVNALNFLIKPIKKEKLFELLDKATNQMNNKEKFIIVKNDGINTKISLKDIFSCISDKNYVDIFAQNKSYRVRMTLTQLLDMLDDRFFKVSR